VSWDEELARLNSWVKDIRAYVEFKTSPLEVLMNVLKEHGLEKAKIGIEKSYIISSYWEKLLKLMPEADFHECGHIFEKVRSIKTREAIKLLRNAAYKTEKAIATAFSTAKLGDTELSISRQMRDNAVNFGAEGICHNSLVSGTDSYAVHLNAREKRISSGEVVHVDFGGIFSRYHTDISRNAVGIKANPEQEKRYRALYRAERKTIEETMHVGKRAFDVYNFLKKEFKKNNIPFEGYHGPGHVGHSIGLETHEPPLLHPYNNTKFEENMVLCIEPIILELSWAWYHVEDMVLITKDGPEILSNFTTDENMYLIEA